MKVYLEKEGKYVDADGTTVSEILSALGINPTTVIISVNGALAIPSSKVSSGDEIKIFSVVSGG